MKKLLLILVIVFFAGCAKDEIIKTTYQVVNDIKQSSVCLNCTMYGVIAYSYSSDEILRKDYLTIIHYMDKSEKIEVPYDADLIKISTWILLRGSNTRMYFTKDKILKKGKNNIIIINLL